MSDNQLREAYSLMKQGDKKAAAQLVQDVLREDRNNLNAWWLMSHLLEDEDKVVRSLETVLTLNPEHLGARKRLSELRPEYAHLYAAAGTDKEKSKTDQVASQYWDKLYSPPLKKQASLNLSGFSVGLMMRLIFFLIFVASAALGGLFNVIGNFSATENNQVVQEQGYSDPILARMENSPEGLMQAFNEAYYREDIATLYTISCEAYHPEITAMMADFDSPHPENITVDFSETRFVLDKAHSNDNYAYVSVHGVTHVQDGGIRIVIDWDTLAEAAGYDTYGHYLRKIDGSWKVCVSD